MRYLIQILVIAVFLGYSNLTNNQPVPGSKKIYILKHQWHTGIIFKIEDIKSDLDFLVQDFGDSEYIEVGWGDKDFYMAREETVWLVFKAAIWPTKSVLHVAEIKNNQLMMFEEDEIIEIELDDEDLDKLILYIKSSFYLDENKRPEKLGKGLYGKSQFYLSEEKYHLFKTCNVWMAKGLKKGGVPIHPFYAFTSKNIIKQLTKQSC